MELQRLRRDAERKSPHTTVRMRRETSEVLHLLAREEKVTLSDLLQAALFVWAQYMRPTLGATLSKADRDRLTALLTSNQETPAKKNGKKRRVRCKVEG